MSAVNGHHNGVQPGGGVVNGNGVGAGVEETENGIHYQNGAADHTKPLQNGNGFENGNGHVIKVEDEVMSGIQDITISDAMDVDEDGDNKAGLKNGVNKRIGAMKKVVSPKVLQSVDSTMKMGVLSENDVANVPQPPPIVPKCSNGKLLCGLEGLPSYPCKRCHRVFYCSEDHRQQHQSDHQVDCKTVSSLEVINYEEEYSMWLKHAAPHLYDVCLNFVLVWPSLTAQWLPEVTERDNNILRHHLLIGTMTNQEQNHLLICAIDIPDRSKTDEHAAKYDGTLYVAKRINHEAEVNRARYMPQDSNIIATKSSSPEVFIFDVRKHPDVPEDSQFSPLLRLQGHKKEGFGLSWNMKDKGKLLSGSDDALVCLWDVNKSSTASRTFRGHEDVVEDVDWHPEQRNVFASVGDDKRLILWDTRAAATEEAVHVFNDAHQLDINAVSFSPFYEACLATGSSDSQVAVWDMRNMSKKLYSLEYHQAEVMQVQWSPHSASTLASTGKDNRVFVWDLAKVGKQVDLLQSGEEDPAPSELVFVHGGHIANVNDISWNHHEMGMIASVTEDNILQVWKISEDLQAVYKGEDDSDNESGGSVSETIDD